MCLITSKNFNSWDMTTEKICKLLHISSTPNRKFNVMLLTLFQRNFNSSPLLLFYSAVSFCSKFTFWNTQQLHNTDLTWKLCVRAHILSYLNLFMEKFVFRISLITICLSTPLTVEYLLDDVIYIFVRTTYRGELIFVDFS